MIRTGRGWPRRGLASATTAAAAAVIAVTAGCSSSSLPRAVSAAPVLSVVTGLWPLARLASEIGGDKVAVDDPVPAGVDPFTFQPGAAGTRLVGAAGLVIEVGGGFQPGLEAAARQAGRVVDLRRPAAADPYVWLDPAAMAPVVAAVASAMEAADPAAAPLFRRNAEGVDSEVRSLDIDYSSTLSTCPGHDLVTPDNAFASMAAHFGLTDHIAGPAPSSARTAALVSQLRPLDKVAVMGETWVPGAAIEQVAAGLGTGVHQVDTLAGAPLGGNSAQDTYLVRMEQVLGQISAALGCAPEQ